MRLLYLSETLVEKCLPLRHQVLSLLGVLVVHLCCSGLNRSATSDRVFLALDDGDLAIPQQLDRAHLRLR
jgi:hypothetical protein